MKTKVITAVPVPPSRTFVLELTESEAQVLMGVAGITGQGVGEIYSIYKFLLGAGVARRRMTCKSGSIYYDYD
jgi:hypothetical protein